MDIDVQGVKSMKKTSFNSNYIFIQPPSLEVLEQRLKQRGTESEESLKKRLELAKIDMEYGNAEGNFHLVLVNDNLEEAYDKLEKFLKEKYPELKRSSWNFVTKNTKFVEFFSSKFYKNKNFVDWTLFGRKNVKVLTMC